jgi:hypothetical protein
VAMEPTSVRLVLIEGENADGVTVEEDNFQAGTAAQVVAAIIGTREGAVESGYHLMSTGVTWTDPAGPNSPAALREELTARDVGSVMLVSPLLAAAALAQTVGLALNYEHIAMLFVEAGSATLAVVDISDGSIVDLHRQPLRASQGASQGATAAELVTMLAGLDAPGSRANGVFVIGCGVDIVGIKLVLEAATSLTVSAPEEPDMALARGAALASANAPLFASSTAALAYALDPGTGEVSPRALTPTYLDICANADRGEGALAYSALDEDADDDTMRRRRPFVLTGSAMAGAAAIAAGLLVVSSDVRPTAVQQAGPPQSVVTPAIQVPPAAPPEAQLPAPSPPPAAPAPEVAALPAPPPVAQQPPPTVVNMAPVTPRRAPTRQAPPPVQEAPQAAPMTTPPAAVPPPPPVETAPPTPIATMHLRLPFVTIPIPIYPPAPPPPPPEPGPAEPAP